MRREGLEELARRVVARIHVLAVHADAYNAARVAHLDPRPLAAKEIVSDLPGADAADDGEHESAARPQQARALARDLSELGHTVQGAEIRVGPVKHLRPGEPPELVSPYGERLHAILHPLTRSTLAGTLHHARRPIGRRDAMALLCHAHGIKTGAAAEIEEVSALDECIVEQAPDFVPHPLNELVVAARPVVVRGDAVEGGSCRLELRALHCGVAVARSHGPRATKSRRKPLDLRA